MPADLAEIFGAGGRLARHLPGFTYRDAQQRMAELVWSAIARHEHVAVEAGTGIGKTFAYLVPVLLSGRRVIISTGTRTLQDQLFGRDLPLLGAAVGRPVEVALLKGRNNYLCRYRLEMTRQDGGRDPALLDALARVADWARSSVTGDLTDLEDFPDEHPVRGHVTSTVDNCLGARCELLDRCFVLEARRRAQAAQVVVVNHHLLLADLALKEAGFGDLLPGADTVIVDEAHQLPDVAQQFFGVSVSSRELEVLARDVVAESRLAGAPAELEWLADALARLAAEARLQAGERGGRLPWNGGPSGLAEAILEWRAALEALAECLEQEAGARAGIDRCRERCLDAAARVRLIAASDPSEGLRWLEIGERAVAAHWTPLDSGRALGASIDAQGAHWIFTSATLSVAGELDHFLRRVGVTDARTAVLPSPFDYTRNARLYVPEALPEPADEEHVASLLAAVWPLVEAAGGGAFLLFTSYRALHRARAWLEHRATPGPVLVQGMGPRSELLRRFRAAGDAVLLGTGSFWQGVDVRGRALRLVIIDKLPFAVPADPLVRARLEAIRREGGDPFTEFQLPQAVLALKQGVGRLIRDFTDRGLIVLGDPRLRTRPYGRVFLASLPPMPLLETEDAALAFAATLAKGAEATSAAEVPV